MRFVSTEKNYAHRLACNLFKHASLLYCTRTLYHWIKSYYKAFLDSHSPYLNGILKEIDKIQRSDVLMLLSPLPSLPSPQPHHNLPPPLNIVLLIQYLWCTALIFLHSLFSVFLFLNHNSYSVLM